MYEKLIKKAGYKITRPRKLILDYFVKHKHPLSAADMHRGLSNHMDKVTIYRILEIMKKIGIVFEEYTDKETLYYLAKEQHHHIVCRQCGHIECVPCRHLFTEIKNFKNISHKLFMTGLCHKCNQ